MNLHDLWFAFAGFAYTVAMIPAMLDRTTVLPLSTSVPTAILLSVSCGAYASLGFYLSATACAISASAYCFMAAYRR